MGLFNKKARQTDNPALMAPRYGLLLVDDEMFNLTTLAGLLEDEYKVMTAASGAEALKLLADPAQAAQIQVIISDQRMPGMSGVELLTEAQKQAPAIKRVLLTGYTDVEAIVSAINDASVYKYVRKPVDSHELRLTLARALESWQLEQDHSALLEQLRQALEKISLLDADKLEFLRYLAHEMNTPLNWLSVTQVVDREELAEDLQEIMGFVDSGQERLRRLVEAVLRYFQVAALDTAPGHDQVDLPVLLRERLAAHCGSVTTTLRQPETLTLQSDAALLGELLDHLLENACTHASLEAQPTVTVTLEALPQGGAILQVHNSGAGLEPERLASLFRPFRYGSDHGERGFGISLATAKALSVALGGALQADCAGAEAGITISLQLPAATPPALTH